MSLFKSSEPENINFHTKRDFADVIKLRILRWEIILDYLCRFNIITRVIIRGSRRVRVGGDVMEEEAGEVLPRAENCR